MFDTIAGLPMHPLVVHVVVVLLPLGALLTAAVAVRARWRPLTPWVVTLNAVTTLASIVAVKSGEAFQHRLSALSGGAKVAAAHAREGRTVPYAAITLLLASVFVLTARRRDSLARPAAVVAIVVSLGAIGWVVEVGHSGATAVWGYVGKASPTATGG